MDGSGSLTVGLQLSFNIPQSASNQQELPLIRRNVGYNVISGTARLDKFTVIIEQNDIRLVECRPVQTCHKVIVNVSRLKFLFRTLIKSLHRVFVQIF